MSKIKINFEENPMITAKKQPLVKIGLYMYTMDDSKNHYVFRAIINNKVLSKIILNKEIKTSYYDSEDGDQIEVMYCDVLHRYIINDSNPNKRKELSESHTIPIDTNCLFGTLLGDTIKTEQEAMNPFKEG
jgi:hypothetical protein